jgi:hypothetical protein
MLGLWLEWLHSFVVVGFIERMIVDVSVVLRVLIDVGVPSHEGVVKVGFPYNSADNFISANV